MIDNENNLEEALKEEIKREMEEVEYITPELEKKLKEELKLELKKLKIKEKVKERVKEELKKKREKIEEEEEEFLRFDILFRIQHIILITSVIILILTGLPLKFPDTFWANFMFRTFGSIASAGIAHRIGAFLLIAFFIFHMFYIIFIKEGRKNLYYWFPRPKDFLDLCHNILYFLGKRKEGAKFDRFSYIEKFDYWAVYWGCVIMIGSGIVLWAHNFAMRYVPKFVLDMAKEAHSDEALLATLAITIWHLYNVHLNPDRFPVNWTFWTGKIKKSEMIREHPLEYEKMISEKENE